MSVSPAENPEDVEAFWNGTRVELEIRHSNYDYPKQPKDRLIKVRASACIGLVENIERVLGRDLYELTFTLHPRGIECFVLDHPECEIVRSIGNATQLSLFVAESIELEETTLAFGL